MTQLPTGWAPARVEDLVADGGITDGPFGSNLKTAHYRDSGPRVIRLQNVGDGVFRDERAHIEQDHYERLVKHAVLPGDVLIASLGETLPRACQAPDIGPAIVKADVIRARTASGVSSAYLMWALNSPQIRERVANQIKGVGRPRFSLGGLRVLEVPLAPTAEQERIVAAIEEAFSLLDAGEAALHNIRTRLKRMRDSVLTAAVTGQLVPQDPTDTPAESRMLEAGVRVEEPRSPLPTGWACAQLTELLSETIGGVWGAEPGADEVNVRVLRVTEMKQDGTLEPATAAQRSITSSQLRSRRLRRGDLLLEKSGGGPTRAVGRVGMVRQFDDPSVCANFMQLMRAETRVMTPEFLELLLRQFHASGGTAALQTATTNIRNLKMKDYFVQVHAVPPLEEQDRIVAEVERQFSFIEAAERAVDAGLARSKGLRRSVLKAAFEGRLVEQDPSDEPASVLLDRIAAERAAATPRTVAPGRVRGRVVAS